jgi:hypothetical protein
MGAGAREAEWGTAFERAFDDVRRAPVLPSSAALLLSAAVVRPHPPDKDG